MFSDYLRHFSQGWFATPQDVLHADWQEVWHSPQPPSFVLLTISLVLIVLIRFIVMISYLYKSGIVFVIIPRPVPPVKCFRRVGAVLCGRAVGEPGGLIDASVFSPGEGGGAGKGAAVLLRLRCVRHAYVLQRP